MSEWAFYFYKINLRWCKSYSRFYEEKVAMVAQTAEYIVEKIKK